MQVKLYVFRHTESYDNVYHLFSGQRDVALTETGIEQAKILAERLKNEDFKLAYCTPLQRTQRCLEIVLDGYHPEVEIRIDKRISERSYGWLQGQSKDKWAKYAYPLFKLFHRSYIIPPPGGESLSHVKKRVDLFMNDLLAIAREKKCNIAICAHGNSMRPIRQYFEGFENEELNKIESKLGEVFEYYIDVD